MLQRILSLTAKEFIQIRRDRRTLVMILIVPVIQLFIFGYALSTEVRNISTAVWDASHSRQSRDLIAAFRESAFFFFNYYAANYEEVAQHIESGRAKVALVIPPDYASRIEGDQTVSVQFFVDGSDPTVAVHAVSYASIITQARSVELLSHRLRGEAPKSPLLLETRVWYNPGMESVVFNVPGLMGVILQMMTVMLTAQAIVRERELGTIEQLNVAPLRPLELILGKLLLYIAIGYVQIILILIAAVTLFAMPMRGSVLLLLLLCSVFLTFSLGIGLLISTVSKTQFQAMQMGFLTQIPSILLSGFIFPIETMPQIAQWIAAIIPLTYFLHIIRGIVVKGVGIEYLWTDVLVLAVIGVVTLLLSASRVQRTLA